MYIVWSVINDRVRPRLRQELHGFTYLIEVLDLTLRGAEEAQRQLNDQEVDLCCEVLKILFNVTVSMEATCLDEVTSEAFIFQFCFAVLIQGFPITWKIGKQSGEFCRWSGNNRMYCQTVQLLL